MVVAPRPNNVRPVPAPSPLAPGSVVVGKYRLESLIGQGGMGEVWVATNLVLESRVALKLLLRSLVKQDEAAQRLLREARAAARVSHRNIVQVFDFGYIETGQPFIVMELLRGESLGERLARAVRLPAIQAVETLVPVAHALSTAHTKGIIHRDLKPWNVFLAVDESNVETPKVVDFGIAKMSSTHVQRVTMDGTVLGSPEYLSPEQALGEPDIDARADIWALAVTLYETITGRLPFEDAAYNRLLRRIIEDDPIPTTAHAAGDDRLWQILRKGLAKKREERWQSAFEMGSALEQWLESHNVHSTGGTFRRSFEAGVGSTLELTDADFVSGAALPASGAETRNATRSGRRPNLMVTAAAAGVLLGLGAAAFVALRIASPAQPPSPAVSSSSPVTIAPPSTMPAPSPPASIASARANESLAASAPASTAPSALPTKSIAPPRGAPAPARTGSKTGPVPAIPTEPNF